VTCLACGRGFHRECKKCQKGKCHAKEVSSPTEHEENAETLGPRDSKKRNLKDPESTGRKRAAQLYPIDPDASCEWKGLRNCGGGRRPIIGCLDGKQQDCHHGPVKTTTRNELGNVHRICKACHVHWHELNDLIYDVKEYNLLPHDPVPAEDMEIIQNTLDWTSGAMKKRFELASSKNQEKHRAKLESD
jgi:hypothetical protein